MQEYDACRLITVNLFSFVIKPFTKDARFDLKKFYEINYEAQRLMDDLVDLELEHIQRIINKIKNDPEPEDIKQVELELWEKIYKTTKSSRRTGLGITALGDTLAALNIKYDSDDAFNIVNEIMRCKMLSELDCTIDLAILRGTFEGWEKNLEFNINTDKNGMTYSGRNKFYQMIIDDFPIQASRMEKYGRRNVSWSCVAPTGTVSLMTQTTSGIEPLFQPFYTRRKKVNPNDENVRVDFTDQNGDTWQEFPVLHPKFRDWIKYKSVDYGISFDDDAHFNKWISELDNTQLTGFFEDSPWYNSTANDIDWIKRVEMQSLIQKYVSHSISSTINLPKEVTEQEVSDIYMESWKKGLKGITVYRDGSRSGVLVSDSNETSDSFEYKDAPKRPKVLPGEAHVTKIKNVPYTVTIGLLDNKPYEIFITPSIIKGEGVIIKQKKGEYDFVQVNDSNSTHRVLTDDMTDEQAAITRLVSTSLRHGADIKFIVEQLNKTPGDMFGFTKGLARVLKKYIPEGSKSTVSCNDCGSTDVIFEEGCHKCLSCGSSKCG